MNSRYKVIRGKFTKGQVISILGKPHSSYTELYVKGSKLGCGLAAGRIQSMNFAEYDGVESSHCWVSVHSNGICVSPSLQVDCDRKLSDKLYSKLVLELDKIIYIGAPVDEK